MLRALKTFDMDARTSFTIQFTFGAQSAERTIIPVAGVS